MWPGICNIPQNSRDFLRDTCCKSKSHLYLRSEPHADDIWLELADLFSNSPQLAQIGQFYIQYAGQNDGTCEINTQLRIIELGVAPLTGASFKFATTTLSP